VEGYISGLNEDIMKLYDRILELEGEIVTSMRKCKQLEAAIAKLTLEDIHEHSREKQKKEWEEWSKKMEKIRRQRERMGY
jgi:predicted  nucleic acid-binding Zn-ribbon protein